VTYYGKPFLVPRKRLHKHALRMVQVSEVGKRYCDRVIFVPDTPARDVQRLLLHRQRLGCLALSLECQGHIAQHLCNVRVIIPVNVAIYLVRLLVTLDRPLEQPLLMKHIPHGHQH